MYILNTYVLSISYSIACIQVVRMHSTTKKMIINIFRKYFKGEC